MKLGKEFTEVNRVTKEYLGITTIGKKFEIENFAKIESTIKLEQDGNRKVNTELGFRWNSWTDRQGSLAKKWHETLKKLTDVIKNIETQLKKDIQGKNIIQSKIQSFDNPDYTINSTFSTKQTFTEVKAIESAQGKFTMGQNYMITKYHCPVRFQGKAIMNSIDDFLKKI